MGSFDENDSPEAHFAKAFQDIARGEQTAGAIENHLTRLEQEIDRLLGSVEAAKEDVVTLPKREEEKAEGAEKQKDEGDRDTSGTAHGNKNEQSKQDKQ